MSDDTPSIPWYKSRILQGLLTIVVSQVATKVASRWHVDIGLYGLTVANVVEWLMDAISAAAATWAFHARVTKPIPDLTLTQAGADKANLVSAPAPPFSRKETTS